MIEEHSNLTEKFIKKGFWLYFFSFVGAPLGYIVKIIVSYDLSVEEIGILYGVLGLVGLLSSLNDFGMTESLNFFVPKYITEKRYDKVKSILLYAFLTQIVTGCTIAAFLYFGSDFIAHSFFKNEASSGVLKVFTFYFLGINTFQVFNTFFMSIQDTFYGKITEFLRMIFVLSFTLYFFLGNHGSILSYSSSWVLSIYMGIIFGVSFFYLKYYKVYLKTEKTIFSKKLFKEIFYYAIIVLLGAQAGSILSQVDMQMIIYLLGAKDAGYYTNYISIISVPFILIGPIFSLIFPIVSELYGKKEYGKIRHIKQLFTKLFIAIGIGFNLLFFVFAQNIAFILFGVKFIESGIIMKYSILLLTFNFLLQINFNILAGMGKVKERLKIIISAIVINIILNYIGIKYMGVYGSSLATGIGWLYIRIRSEITLGKDYFEFIPLGFISKNIIYMCCLALISSIYITGLFSKLSRLESLLFMFIIGLVWAMSFSLINLKEFKIFVSEIKKVRK